jgi:RNA-directed DNA polymerase
MSFTFKFSPMSRYWIPKPNKPGKMRAITQPNQRDIIVMESLSVLLNIIYGEIFMSYSHGFRPGRGAITFFSQVKGWGPVERLCKVDIVGCFDNLDHGLLKDEIRAYIGEENEPIINPKNLGTSLFMQIDCYKSAKGKKENWL